MESAPQRIQRRRLGYQAWPQTQVRAKVANDSHSSARVPKSSNRVWLPRLEIKTARRVQLRRAVSRLSPASYVIHEGQHCRFKRMIHFGPRKRTTALTCCRIESYRVQIQSPLSQFVTAVRVSLGRLPVRTRSPRSQLHLWPFFFVLVASRIEKDSGLPELKSAQTSSLRCKLLFGHKL